MLADKFILDLDSVQLQEKHLLPGYSGIYYVIDNRQGIWYIGRSINLQNRWNSEQPHHRYEQLLFISSKKNIDFSIYYSQENKNRLDKLEKIQIKRYQPILNYTRILTKDYNTREKILERIHAKPINDCLNTSLKILSIDKTYVSKYTNNTFNQMINVSNKNYISNNSKNKFQRKFILLENDEIELNFELEICIDSQKRYFVRHYTFFAFHSNSFHAADLDKADVAKGYLSTLKSCCKYLYSQSFRWLGYKLSCQSVLLVDEEENFEIETTEIMLPFRMFVELVEYEWMRAKNMAEILEKKELDGFKNESLSIKVAKYLHDNNLTLYKLLGQIDIDRA